MQGRNAQSIKAERTIDSLWTNWASNVTRLVLGSFEILSCRKSFFHELRVSQRRMSRIAEKMSKKSGEKYEDIMRYIRVKISFLVLKATLLCLRGSRSIRQNIDVGGEDFSQSLRELGL